MNLKLHLQAIFDDMRDCAVQIRTDQAAFFRQFAFLPPTISVGDGRSIYVSKKSVAAIQAIARISRENSADFRAALPHKEMVELVSHAIGSIIVASAPADATEFTIPLEPDSFLIALRQRMAADLSELDRELTHLFGAWVIQGDTITLIRIGPVQFSLRSRWVSDAVVAGLITEGEASHLLQYWQRGGPIDSDLAQGIDGDRTTGIAGAVGPCPWVCAVQVFGHTHTRSQQKALLAAHIALAAISLAWDTPSQQARESGLIYSIGPERSRHTITFSKASVVETGSHSVQRLGRFLTIGDANAFFSKSDRRLDTVGAALGTLLSTTPTGPKRLLEEALCQSLIWFGEACNEPLEFMAIVKFAAALDTLAKGGKVGGICKLIQRRYPMSDPDAPFLTDGTTVKQLVVQIYETGRSRIVHGTRSSLIDDLEQLRSRAELLATIVLRACIGWLDTYSGPDDVSAFATAA
jgi:hypothetical protein